MRITEEYFFGDCCWYAVILTTDTCLPLTSSRVRGTFSGTTQSTCTWDVSLAVKGAQRTCVCLLPEKYRGQDRLAAVLAAEQRNAEAALGLAYIPKFLWARSG